MDARAPNEKILRQLLIGVTGHNGRLGRALVRLGCAPIVADVTDLFALRTAVKVIGPDVVIHCAALTDVDGCEDRVLDAAKINAGGVANLCLSTDAPIVYISTDYVFDGAMGPYTEEAAPCPVSVYGWSKLGGELALKARHRSDDLIVRTTMLFGNGGADFVSKVADRLRRREFVYLPDALFGSPTYIPHLAEDLLAAVECGANGVLNLVGGYVLSRYMLGQRIAHAIGADLSLVRRGEVVGKAPRPLRAGLTVDLALRCGFPFRDPIVAIEQLLKTPQEETGG